MTEEAVNPRLTDETELARTRPVRASERANLMSSSLSPLAGGRRGATPGRRKQTRIQSRWESELIAYRELRDIGCACEYAPARASRGRGSWMCHRASCVVYRDRDRALIVRGEATTYMLESLGVGLTCWMSSGSGARTVWSPSRKKGFGES